jgi:hypothetical protein
MSSGEYLPPVNPDPEFRRSMGLLALRFELLGAAALAEKKNIDHLANHKNAGFLTQLRYVLPEGANRYVPVRTKRIILQPEKPVNRKFEVERLILRVPTALEGGAPLPIIDPNDLFVETVSTSGDRARHLLNGAGLWLYHSERDFELISHPETDGDLFRVKGAAVAVPERVGRIAKLLGDPAYLPVLQSAENIERP